MTVTGAHPDRALVVVVGAINVDFVVTADRLPAPGETVVGDRLERHGGGKGANAAVAAARVGAPVRFVGAVGDDETVAVALRELRDAGVDLGGVAELPAERTGAALIVVDADGENQIAVAAGANLALTSDWVAARVGEALPRTGCVLVSTEIAPDVVAAAVRCAHAAGVTCVLNAAPPIPVVAELFDQAPVLTPNARELTALCAIVPGLDPDADTAMQAGALAARTGSPVVVTLGRDGALIATPDAPPERIAAPVADVVDTTGAGDTFNGVLAAQLASGAELLDAVGTAIVAASLSVTHAGARTGMPTRRQIEAALHAVGTVTG
jgi:ribokinase